MASQVFTNFILPTTTADNYKSSSIDPKPIALAGAKRRRSSSFVQIAGRGKRCIIRAQELSSDIAPAVTSAGYGILLLSGGLLAYARTGSKGSLAGGLTGAALMTTAYFFMQASETKEVSYALAFASALLFAAVFGIRVAATRKIFPAGFLLGLSVGASTVFISPYLH